MLKSSKKEKGKERYHDRSKRDNNGVYSYGNPNTNSNSNTSAYITSPSKSIQGNAGNTHYANANGEKYVVNHTGTVDHIGRQSVNFGLGGLAQSHDEANWTNLPPGNHTFVRTSSNPGTSTGPTETPAVAQDKVGSNTGTGRSNERRRSFDFVNSGRPLQGTKPSNSRQSSSSARIYRRQSQPQNGSMGPN